MATVEDVTLLLASYLIEQNRDLQSGLSDQLTEQLGALLSINESNQNALNEIAGTLNTEFAEVLAEIDRLEAQEEAQNLDFTGIRTAVQNVTDTVSAAVPDVDPVVVEPDPEG